MRCDRAREAIVLRGAGALDGDELAALQRHLGQCNACVEAALAEQRLLADFAALRDRVPVPVRLEQRVVRAVRDLEPGAADRVTWTQLVPVASAAAAGAAGLGWALWAWRDAFAAAGDATGRLLHTAADVASGIAGGLAAAASDAAAVASSGGTPFAAGQPLAAGLIAGAVFGYALLGATVAWVVGRNLVQSARAERRGPR